MGELGVEASSVVLVWMCVPDLLMVAATGYAERLCMLRALDVLAELFPASALCMVIYCETLV